MFLEKVFCWPPDGLALQQDLLVPQRHLGSTFAACRAAIYQAASTNDTICLYRYILYGVYKGLWNLFSKSSRSRTAARS
jgi:hypothetical protein